MDPVQQCPVRTVPPSGEYLLLTYFYTPLFSYFTPLHLHPAVHVGGRYSQLWGKYTNAKVSNTSKHGGRP